MKRRPFRHATAIEREYRDRLIARLRSIATTHHESRRHDSYLAPIGGLVALARQVGRFIGAQVNRMLVVLALAGAPVVLPRSRVVTEAIAVPEPPSAAETALYGTWANAQALAVGANENRLAVELLARPDAEARAESRAKQIARDGIGWLTGKIVETRQRQAGVVGYIWNTCEDDRVREMHAALQDSFQRWDDPPITNVNGDRNHAGQDYGCRCWGEPAFDADALVRRDSAPVRKSTNAPLLAISPWYVLPKAHGPMPAGSIPFFPDLEADASNLDDEDRQDIADHNRLAFAFDDREAAIEAAMGCSGYVGTAGKVCPPTLLRGPVASVLPTAFYGTGIEGGSHHWRLGQAPRGADGQIPGMVREMIAGVDGGPAAIPGPGNLDVQVYDVDPTVLAWLDAYEAPAFVRETRTTTDGRDVSVYRYFAEREPGL